MFYSSGSPDDPVFRSDKRLADIEIDADRRPSTAQIDITAGRMWMRVASLGAIVAHTTGELEQGKLEIVGLSLSSRELPPID